jgi:wobble nucleotide-excising tRNase
MRQLARTCDPGRFRVRLIKQAVSDMQETMVQAARANELEQELAEARREIARLSEIVRMMKDAQQGAEGDDEIPMRPPIG